LFLQKTIARNKEAAKAAAQKKMLFFQDDWMVQVTCSITGRGDVRCAVTTLLSFEPLLLCLQDYRVSLGRNAEPDVI
jgi:hypothetical protein